MSTESPFISAHHPNRLAEKSKKELFRDVIEAAENDVQLDLVDYLSAFLKSEGYTLKVETGDFPDPNKPLVIAVNHHSRQRFFTTEESLRVVAIASVSARTAGVTDKNIAWMIRELTVPPIGIGKMARQVQNATGPVFDSIPAKTIMKLSMRSFIPRFRETMTKEDKESLIARVAHRIQNNYALGTLPEQVPGFELKPHHRNFERTLDNLKFLSADYDVQTLATFYEGKEARAVYGPVVSIKRDTDVHLAALDITRGIAQGLPGKLKESYIKSQLQQ